MVQAAHGDDPGVWRLQLRRQVRDPALRRKLVPDYPIGCKRVLFSNDWYPALDRDHVDVVTERGHRRSSRAACAPPTAGCTRRTC